jgi:hypothetical protein
MSSTTLISFLRKYEFLSHGMDLILLLTYLRCWSDEKTHDGDKTYVGRLLASHTQVRLFLPFTIDVRLVLMVSW